MRQFALIVGLLGIPLLSSVQTRQDSWASLNSLRAGEKIEVIETNLKKHKETFATVSDEILQLREGDADVGIKKETVMRVTVLDKNHRLRNALIIGAVGAGVGAGIGAAASRCSTQSSFNF
jgi:thiamine pyrophosphate-dependent acetolactate synthase large subunit-like protein